MSPLFSELGKAKYQSQNLLNFSSLGSLQFQDPSPDRDGMKQGHDSGPGAGNLNLTEIPDSSCPQNMLFHASWGFYRYSGFLTNC